MNKKLKNTLDCISKIDWDHFIDYKLIIGEIIKYYAPYFKTPESINFDYVIERPYVNQENDVKNFLVNLKKNEMIKDFFISESKTPIKQKEYCPIIIKIINIKIVLAESGLIFDLFDYTCVELFKNELYGEEKQLSIICGGIYKKYQEFQNKELTLHFYSSDDFSEIGSCISKEDIKHIKIMTTLHKLEFMKYLEIIDGHTVKSLVGEKIYPIKASIKIFDLSNIEKLSGLEIIDEIKSEKGDYKKTVFDTEKSIILDGDKTCEIPYNTNQAFLCDFMFNKHENKTRVSWDEIYCFIKGEEDDIEKDGWRIIYNAVNEINKKTKKKLGKEIFVFNQKTVMLV